MPAHIEDLNDWQVDEWPSTPQGEERQAREITELYEILFACPSVEAVTTWSPADGGWLKAPGGLLRADNSVKPAYTALMGKILGEWRTTESSRTDANGELTLEGFRGDYDVLCEGGKALFTLDGRNDRIDIELAG
jgi:hypothetical protein